MATTPAPTVWPTISSADAEATIRFAVDALGFRETLVVRDDADPSTIVHSQLSWPPGGGVMISSAGTGSLQRAPSGGCVYLVVESDADVDRVHAAALAAGATELLAPVDQDYGGRGSTVQDSIGNVWSVGSYRGEPR